MKSSVALIPSIQRMLAKHLSQFPLPYRACSCMTIENGKVNLVVRFVANAGSWSHVAQGFTLSEAFRSLRQKLKKDFRNAEPDVALRKCALDVWGSCGNHECANSGRCPNLALNTPFFEVAEVTEE